MKILRVAVFPFLAFSFFAFVTAVSVPAQTIDVAKISCKQFLIGDLMRRDYLALWLSGYYNGTRNDTVVESSTVQKIADKVGTYCRANLDATLMDAVQTALGVTR
jgi:hypothetical protein